MLLCRKDAQSLKDQMKRDTGEKNHQKNSEPIQRMGSDAPVDNLHARYPPCPCDCCHARAMNPTMKYINATIKTTVTKLAGVQLTIAASAMRVSLRPGVYHKIIING